MTDYIDFETGDVNLPTRMPTSEVAKDPTYLNQRVAELTPPVKNPL